MTPRALAAVAALTIGLLLPLTRLSSGAAHPARHKAALALPFDGPYLHTDGGALRDAHGRLARLSGINWFGLETCSFAPDGLGVRSWWDLLDQARALGFNIIRLPFSDQLLDPGSYPRYINGALNPDLRGLSGLQVMDRIIHGAGQRGLRVIIDRHRPDCAAQSPLWYTARYPERRWIGDLVFLARRYRHEPAVIGVDLHNEPHGAATWGDGNPATDWRLAAERAGNAVLRVNPHWLIFVQGVQTYHGDIYWWGGNLEGAATAPVRLTVPHRLVYEAHDYGPGVYWQGWFSAPDFPYNLPRVWRRHWAYLQEAGTAPVLLGEFGGRSVAPATAGTTTTRVQRRDGAWQRALVWYLAHHPNVSFTYWSFTPDSNDTGGLLDDDWQTANAAKESLLRGIQGAAIPLPGALPPPASPRVLASDVVAPDHTQQSLTIRIVDDGPRPLNLAHAELRYWLDSMAPLSPTATVSATVATPSQDVEATVDWSSTGANTVVALTGTVGQHAYVALQIAPVSSTLAILPPYGGVATMVVRLHRADWAPYSPAHDWSYRAGEAPLLTPRLTLRLGGHTIWGVSPLDSSPQPSAYRTIARHSAT